MPSMQTILHPTDFSESSRHAFQTACSLVKDQNSRLIVLHVVPPFTGPVPVEPVPNPLVPAESQEFLSGRFSWPQPSDPKILVEHRVAEGEAAEQILQLAKALPCDLIVMGTHGRTGLSRFLTGSVAEQVLRKAGCPVLAVKTPLPETPSAPLETRAKPAEILGVEPLGVALANARTRTLARTDEFEILRLIVPAGRQIPEHKAKGALIVQCLEGRVAFTALGKTQNLESGDLLYLPAGETHSIKGLEDASLLLTVLLPKG
jgi:nucleotide-binding universal stress UspA family protein/quercetin dioxygenase-like cupin family protein